MDKNYFEILPNEMIIEIISYLKLSDTKSLRLTCTAFEQLSQDQFFTKAVLKCSALKKDLDWLMTINKKIKTIHFNHRFDEHEVDKIISHFKDSITELKLSNCEFSEKDLIKSFDQLPHLKTVRINTLRVPNFANVIMALYQRVETIHIKGRGVIDRTIIEENNNGMMESTIRDLSVQLCSQDSPVFRSSGIYCLLELIGSSLRTLNLSRVFNKDLLKCLADLNLNLNKLKIWVHKDASDQDFVSFVMSMKNLKEISLSGPGMTDQRVKFICENIPGLKQLEFAKIRDEGLNYVAALPKLESLILTNLWIPASIRFVNCLGNHRNNHLAHLELYGHLNNDTIILSATNFKNLTKLILKTRLRFSPDLIPLIYENLPLLEKLALKSYGTDFDSRPSRLTRPQFKSSDPRIYQLKRLRKIVFVGFAQVPGASFDDIANLRFLNKIHVTTEENLELQTFKKMVNNNPELKSLTIKRSLVGGVQNLYGITVTIPNRLLNFQYRGPSGRADRVEICIKRTL